MAEDNKEDPISEETAAIRRLHQAGIRNKDQKTIDAAVVRAKRLSKKEKIDITNPTVSKILGFKKEDSK